MNYLGQHFSFSTDAEMAKSNLINNTNEAINFAHMLQILPVQKFNALNLQLRAKLSFLLSHYTVCTTWIKIILDNLVTGQVRRWLDLPRCAGTFYSHTPKNSGIAFDFAFITFITVPGWHRLNSDSLKGF